MRTGLRLGLSPRHNKPALSGVTDDGVIFEGFEEPPTVEVISDEIVIRGKIKAGFYGKFVYPVEALQSNFAYKVNFVADLSKLTLGGNLAALGFGFKQGNKFRLVLLQGQGSSSTRAVSIRGAPPHGWNKPTGHTEIDHGAPTTGNQHGADVRLVTSVDGASYEFDTSADAQANWDNEATAQAFTPFADVAEAAQAGVAGYFHSSDTGEFTVTLTWVSEAADAVAPTLSAAIGTATGQTTADLSVDSDEGNGTLYEVVTQSATGPTKAQVKAGKDHTGAAADDSGSQAVSGTGTQNISGGATGLSAGTTYYVHYMHEDAIGNQSTVATSASFATESADRQAMLGGFPFPTFVNTSSRQAMLPGTMMDG